MRLILLLLMGVACAVVNATPASAADVALRANGRIVFASDDGLASMNPGGSGQWGLRFTRSGQGAPAWAPDGSALALTESNASGTSLSTMEPDGTNLRLVIGRPFANSPSWSPDGKELAFDDGANIYVAGLDGNAKALVPGLAPAWSPDGDSIAYVQFTTDGRSDVFVFERSSGRVSRLTNAPSIDVAPAWSPGGEQLVFVSDRDGARSLYTMKRDGSGQAALTHGPADTEPAWSPDGKQIVFVRNSQIWVVGSDGTNPRQLTRGNASSESPAWQPLSAGPVGCTLWGTQANDLLVGTVGRDVICGLGGDDSLVGLERSDELRGDDGGDWIAGGRGRDVLRGGDGDDLIDARDGSADSVAGDAGADTARVDPRALDARSGIERVAVSRDVAAWHPTTASNQEPTNPSVLVVDGRVDDFWSSGASPPQWVEVDLLEPTTVASIRVIASDVPAGASVLVLGRGPNTKTYRLLHRFRGPMVFKRPSSYAPKRPWRRVRYLRLHVPVANVPLGSVTWPELEVFPAT